MARRTVRLVGVALAITLVMGGCGDDDDAAPASDRPSSAAGVSGVGSGELTIRGQRYPFDTIACEFADDGSASFSGSGTGPGGAISFELTRASEPASPDERSAPDASLHITDDSGLDLVSDGSRMSIDEVDEGRWLGSFMVDPEASTPSEMIGGSLVFNCPTR